MPGRRFTEKEDRMAEHVAASMRKQGMSGKRAKSVGYAVANKRKHKRGRRK